MREERDGSREPWRNIEEPEGDNLFLLYVSIHISGVILNAHVSGFDEIERACEDFFFFLSIYVSGDRCMYTKVSPIL